MSIQEVELDEVWKHRLDVMWPGKTPDFVMLPDDSSGFHYGYYVKDRLVSVISLFIEGEQAQFRKFATLPEEQGKGYGSALLTYTLEQARKLGACRIWCNARSNKVDFYKKFGLEDTGAEFEREGLSYAILERTF